MRPWASVCALAVSAGSLLAPQGALAAHWSRQRVPIPSGSATTLGGVSCPSARSCVAVGGAFLKSPLGTSQVPVVERWDGGAWRVQRPSDLAGVTDGAFQDVACPSSRACIAVGEVVDSAGHQVPLAEHWNGTSWQMHTVPSPSGLGPGAQIFLTGVSCSSPSACMAVGSSSSRNAQTHRGLAERWNGTAWTLENPAQNGHVPGLGGVSCPAASSCLAVDGGLVDLWEGTTWQPRRIPSQWLAAVSCVSADACTTVGAGGKRGLVPQAYRWDGAAWRRQVLPRWARASALTRESLYGVSCPSRTDCTAVGFASDQTDEQVPLAARWNGVSWTAQTVSQPTSVPRTLSYLWDVSCTAATACTAVGYYFYIRRGTYRYFPLAERYS